MPATEPPVPGSLRGILAQWPLVPVFVLVWCSLWQDFSLHVMLTGLVFGVLVLALFPMPGIPFTGRLNLWWALVFTLRFLVDVVRSSLSISAVVLLRGRRVESSVVGVRLRSHDDLVITLVSHALALVPGSIVLDVDRAHAALYLHCLDVTTEREVEEFRAKSLSVEAGIIRAVGSRSDLELLRRHPDSAPPADEVEDHRRHPVFRRGAHEQEETR